MYQSILVAEVVERCNIECWWLKLFNFQDVQKRNKETSN